MKVKTILSICLLATLIIQPALCQTISDDLYKDLPFAMDKVKQPSFSSFQVNIKDFGAKNDGITSNTKAFASAIDAVVKKGGGTVIIPEGLWLTGPIILKSNVELRTEKGALVLFTSNYDEYPMIKTWYEGQFCWRTTPPIYAADAENIAITGEGVFDGNGTAWRPLKKFQVNDILWKKITSIGGVLTEDGQTWYPTEGALKGSKSTIYPGLRTKEQSDSMKVFLRPVMVNFTSCKKILLSGVTFQNPPAWTLHPLLSQDITINNVKVANQEWMTNGDAIDVESCKNVLILNSTFDAGDDAICIKSGRDEEGRKRGVPTENVIVSNCIVYHGHGGFVVGSEMSGGARNMKVSHCTFMGTEVGLRFKSKRGRGGVVENIYISDINMINIEREAILYDLYYSAAGKKTTTITEEPVNEGTPQFKDIYMKNIVCKGAERAIRMQGLPEMNVKNINLENAVIEARTGVLCIDANQINLKNVQVYTKTFPVVEINNAQNIMIDNFKCYENEGAIFTVSGAKTSNISLLKSIKKAQDLSIDASVKQDAVKIKP